VVQNVCKPQTAGINSPTGSARKNHKEVPMSTYFPEVNNGTSFHN
jgi:hypothetical protein